MELLGWPIRRMRGGRQSQPVLLRSEWAGQALVRCDRQATVIEPSWAGSWRPFWGGVLADVYPTVPKSGSMVTKPGYLD